MKQILLSLFINISLTALAQNVLQPQKFILKGKVIGQDNQYVHLAYVDNKGKYQHDSCLLVKGVFEFTGNISEPTLADFYGRRDHKGIADPNFTDFYIEPTTMEAEFKAEHFKEGDILGSKTQKEYSDYLMQINRLEGKTRDSVTFDFIREHPNSFVSANLLVYQTQKLTLDSLKMFFDFFSPFLHNSKVGKYINEFVAKAENLLPGKKLPVFTQIDKDGKSVSLKDFLGKYVLIDFWASWCIPCREEHPFLKKAYEKYNNKGFAIVSISLDRAEDKNKWLEAIDKDDLTWIQLCDFKGWNGEVVNRYNLLGRGIPSNFLIDREGRIVARDLRGKELENKLSELLQ